MNFLQHKRDTYNDQDDTGIEYSLLFSTAGLKLSALAVQPRGHTSGQYKEKYTDSRFNFFDTGTKIVNEL